MNISEGVYRDAKELGLKAISKMDPLCEKHLRELEYHPVSDEFRGSAIYNEFERLVARHAEEQGIDLEDVDATLHDELRWEVRDAFDEGYYNPSEDIQCVQCLHDGEIDIRVNDPESIGADSILDGKSQSGHVGRGGGLNEWR